jgi:hypothetical protein
VARRPPNPIDPVGDGRGVAARRLRIAPADVARLGGMLAGYDGLVSLHDEPGSALLVLVTTSSRLAELDEVLAGLRSCVPFEIVAGGATDERGHERGRGHGRA